MIGAEVVYVLCTVTSAMCAWLLLRAYRRTQRRILMWSGICFIGLLLNNAALFADLILLPQVDLSIWRLLPALIGIGLLCYGLIEERA